MEPLLHQSFNILFIIQIEAFHFISFVFLSVGTRVCLSVCSCPHPHACVCAYQTSHAMVMAKGGPYLPRSTPAPPTHFTCSCSHDLQVRQSHTLSHSHTLKHTHTLTLTHTINIPVLSVFSPLIISVSHIILALFFIHR